MKKEGKAGTFVNVVIIEDTHSLLGKKEGIKIHDKNCFLEPVDIQTAEEWEYILRSKRVPYVLAEVETVLPDPVRYKRGYAIFTETVHASDRND